MKTRVIAIACITGIALALGASAEGQGNAYGKIYADWYYDASDDDALTKKSEAELTRVYLGYKYAIDEHFTADALLDVERADPVKGVSAGFDTAMRTVGVALTRDDRYFAFLKAAYLAWKDILPKTTLSMGQFGYIAFNVQEGFWGKRYIYKSFMDQQGWEPSADLGAMATIAPNDLFTIVAGVVNGEGYKSSQDSYGDYKTGLGLLVNPVKDLTIYLYGDWMPVGSTTDTAQTTAAAFAGYKFQDLLRIGLEYNAQIKQKGVTDHNVNGVSVYGIYSIITPLEVFARYDYAASKDDFNTARDGQTAIGGLQYSPVPKVKIAADYQRFMPKAAGSTASDKVYLNCEFDY